MGRKKQIGKLKKLIKKVDPKFYQRTAEDKAEFDMNMSQHMVKDELSFVTKMIPHHKGAIMMVKSLVDENEELSQELHELLVGIVESQSEEIELMEKLKKLYRKTKTENNKMPNAIENIEFDLLDFIEDDPESLEGFKEIVNEAVEEWLEANGYEDWDVEDYEDIDTTITLKNVSLVPEAELEKEPDEDEEVEELDEDEEE